MSSLWQEFWPSIPRLTWAAVIDIALVAILFYQAGSIIRGRRAAQALAGVFIILLAYLLSILAGLELLRSVLETLAPYTAFALIVMFQSDLKRVLTRLGESRWSGFGGRLELREAAEEILLAVQHMAQQSTGALIVVERQVGLRTFIESGVPVDARVTRDLLLAIFESGGTLHDGAVIVQGGRIPAAACFLPLTMDPTLSRTLGTRHRAALGVSEDTDCLAIVVSEETGRISVAVENKLEQDISIERLAEHLGNVRVAKTGQGPRRLAAGSEAGEE